MHILKYMFVYIYIFYSKEDYVNDAVKFETGSFIIKAHIHISIMMLMLNFLAVLEGDDSSSRHWTDF